MAWSIDLNSLLLALCAWFRFGGIYEGFAEGFVAFVSTYSVLFAQVFDFDYGVRHWLVICYLLMVIGGPKAGY